jgi:inner membrane protein
MPTLIGHALVGWAAAQSEPRATQEATTRVRTLAAVAALLAMLPDVDAAGFALGVPYGSRLGHRGFTHSLAFALGSAAVGFAFTRWRLARRAAPAGPAWRAFLVLLLAAASHPLLDMLTDGGLGVALFAPLSWHRYFFALRPIPVSAIGVDADTGRVLAWEAALLAPLALGPLLANAPIGGRRRPWLRWLPLASTGLALGLLIRNAS